MAGGNVSKPTGVLILPGDMGFDLNDSPITGMCTIQKYSSSATNRPGGTGTVISSANGNYAAQFAIQDGYEWPWYRYRNGSGTWGSWDKVVTASQINDSARYISVNGTSTNVSSSTDGATGTALASITIPTAGIWWLGGCARFAANSTGIRRISVNITSGSVTTSLWSSNSTNAAAASNTFLYFTYVLEVPSANRVYYLNAGQNSGSTLATYGYLRAYKLSV